MRWFVMIFLIAALTACDQNADDDNRSGCDGNVSGCDGNASGCDGDGCSGGGCAGGGCSGGSGDGKDTGGGGSGATTPTKRKYAPPPGDPMANMKMLQYLRSHVQKLVDTMLGGGDDKARGMALMSLPIHVNHFVKDPGQLPELVIPALRKVLAGDVFPKGRGSAALKLASIARVVPEAVDALLAGLDHPDARDITAGMVGQTKPAPDRIVPKLAELLSNESQGTRVAAAMGLAGYGPAAEAAVPALTKLTENDKTQARWRAVLALGRIGPAARSALPSLKKQLATATRGNMKHALQKAITSISK